MNSLEKIYFAQNVMEIEPAPPPPDIDPDDPNPPIINPCAFPTALHPFWAYYNDNIVNSDWFGFSLVPSGQRIFKVTTNDAVWHEFGKYGSFWFSTNDGVGADSAKCLFFSNTMIFSGSGEIHNSRNNGRSIRLVRDVVQSKNDDPDGTVYIDDYTDGSGNVYDGVRIGNLVWLTKNLHTKHFQNSTPIEKAQTVQLWNAAYWNASPAYCVYPYTHALYHGVPISNEDEMIQHYGCLYNWYVIQAGIVTGNYRVPTLAEGEAMRNHLVSEYGITLGTVGTILKSCRQQRHPIINDWSCAVNTTIHPRWGDSPDTQNRVYGLNIYGKKNVLQSGFVPSGFRRASGDWANVNWRSITWTTTKGSDAFSIQRAWCLNLGNQNVWESNFNRMNRRKGYTVRGIRDATADEMLNDRDGTFYVDDYTDGSGNIYDGIKIGMFVITERNLYATVKQDGSGMEHAQLSSIWSIAGENGFPCWAYYLPSAIDGIDTQQEVLDTIGYHYNYFCVDPNIGTPLINQNGYRVPSLEDLQTMWDYLGKALADELFIMVALKSCRQVNHPLA